ncbi:MAG: hypothetical protein ACU84Q_14415 [Gammaproteobacteria bacterium]
MNVDLDTLSKIGEFLGGAVVVVSLLYLAVQAKHSAQQQRSENYGRTVDRAAAVMSQWANNAELSKLVVDGSISMENLEPYDRIRFTWQMNEIFAVYEFTYEQQHLRVLPDHVWGRYSQHLEMWLSLPGVREFWRENPGNFSPSFMDYVNKKILEKGLTPDEAKKFWGMT